MSKVRFQLISPTVPARRRADGFQLRAFAFGRGRQQETHDWRGTVGGTVLGRTSVLTQLHPNSEARGTSIGPSVLRNVSLPPRLPQQPSSSSVQGLGSRREKEWLWVGVGIWASGPEACQPADPRTSQPWAWGEAGVQGMNKRLRVIFQVGPEFIQSVWARGQFSWAR